MLTKRKIKKRYTYLENKKPYYLWLIVGCQSFQFRAEWDNKKEAKWFQDRLVHALYTISNPHHYGEE